MKEKERFIQDISRILSGKTFRSNNYVKDFALDLWYLKDYLKGYFMGKEEKGGGE